MMKTDNIIKLCNDNMFMVTELSIELKQHIAPMLIDNVLVDVLHFLATIFNINSNFIILTSLIIFRKIHIKTTQLHRS